SINCVSCSMPCISPSCLYKLIEFFGAIKLQLYNIILRSSTNIFLMFIRSSPVKINTNPYDLQTSPPHQDQHKHPQQKDVYWETRLQSQCTNHLLLRKKDYPAFADTQHPLTNVY